MAKPNNNQIAASDLLLAEEGFAPQQRFFFNDSVQISVAGGSKGTNVQFQSSAGVCTISMRDVLRLAMTTIKVSDPNTLGFLTLQGVGLQLSITGVGTQILVPMLDSPFGLLGTGVVASIVPTVFFAIDFLTLTGGTPPCTISASPNSSVSNSDAAAHPAQIQVQGIWEIWRPIEA